MSWRRWITTAPITATPMANRSQTTVTGWTSATAILVAMKEAPQTTTANRALAMGPMRTGCPWDRIELRAMTLEKRQLYTDHAPETLAEAERILTQGEI